MLSLFAAASRCGEMIRGGLRQQRLSALRVAASLAVAAASAAVAPAEATTKASHFVLANGMEVVVVPNHRVPVVTQHVWYKAGAAEDPEDQVGVAHFLEHLMFKGTKTSPGNSIERFVVGHGGASINAVTFADVTVYPQTLPKRHLPKMMELEADRMVNLVLSDEVVKTEVGVVQNERRGNENSPTYLLVERVNAVLFPGHPYARSVIGTQEQIATLDRAKAIAFYKRYYAPNNAVLVVAGDVTEAEVRKLAESTFGRIPANKELPKRIVQPMPKQPSSLRVDLEHERVTSPIIGVYFPTDGVGAMSQPDVYALQLLDHIVGASIYGRLFRSLIAEQRVAVDVAASNYIDMRGGAFSFIAQAAPGVSAADVEAALGREIAVLVRDGVTKDEVDEAKQVVLAGKAYEEDNHRSLASTYGQLLARGRTVSDVEGYHAVVAGITAADVDRVIARFLAKTQPVVGVLRPQATAVSKSGLVTK